MKTQMNEALKQYNLKGTLISAEPYGNGHINDTYLLMIDAKKEEDRKLILQRINTNVFHEPQKLMENMAGVTGWIAKKIIQEGGDPRREVLNIVPTAEGGSYAVDSEGGYWRIFYFVPDAVCYDMVDKPEQFYQGAIAFGKFQQMLEDYPAETLHETIKGFHDTYGRFQTFLKAVEEDSAGRVSSALKEIQFVKEREDLAKAYAEADKQEHIPLRVTHNDTKLNNVMLDAETGRGLCVIDLDTVMPGYVMNDFGDAIRFGTNTAAEDEPDTSKVSCSLELYEAFVKGFLEISGPALTKHEIELLPLGAKMMTFEVLIRFLTDYLQGDTYFKTAYADHNLVRTRNQMALLSDMEKKWDQMQEIVEKYA